MAEIKVAPNQLGAEVENLLKEYSDDVIRKMPDAVKEVTADTVKALKTKAGELFKGTKYNKSFKSKKQSTTASGTKYVIYSTEYRLAHLLEKGHWIKNQTGRVYGKTKARPHWAPAEKEAVKELEKKLTEEIEGI